MVVQNVGGQNWCITGDVQMVNWKSYREGERRRGFFKTLPPNRLPPLPSSSFYKITTKSATTVFFLFSFFLSPRSIWCDCRAQKKPAFWSFFTQMASNFVRIVLKNLLDKHERKT